MGKPQPNKGKGICPVCLKLVSITANGKIRGHWFHHLPTPYPEGTSYKCDGSYRIYRGEYVITKSTTQ
jgi:hypothetical protein